MTKIILNPEYKLYEREGTAFCSSRQVAKEFSRRHDHILRTIDELTAPTSGVSEEFSFLNFQESTYKDASGKKNREYLMTKDGFSMAVMEIKGIKSRKFKEAYIQRFNAMETFIKSLQSAKLEFPDFTDAIMDSRPEPKHYHFSNEINMINKIVLGMNAKQFRELHGIEKGTSIRPYLTNEQIKSIENLQRFDIGLITMMEYEERKQTLMKYHEHISVKRIQKGA
jgi:Rha family phage regulatory protein